MRCFVVYIRSKTWLGDQIREARHAACTGRGTSGIRRYSLNS